MLKLTDHQDHICQQYKQLTGFEAHFCKYRAFDLNQPAASPDAFTDVKRAYKILAVCAGRVLCLGILVLIGFLAGCDQSGTSSKPTGGNSSLSTPAVSSGDSLTEAEMMDLMKSHGIWGPMAGWHKYDDYEITRVGPYNKDGKFYPVQVKVTSILNNGNSQASIWDCRFQKNDYGDWEVKKIGL